MKAEVYLINKNDIKNITIGDVLTVDRFGIHYITYLPQTGYSATVKASWRDIAELLDMPADKWQLEQVSPTNSHQPNSNLIVYVERTI